MRYTKLLVLAAAGLVSSGCASRGRHSLENHPVALAAVRADLRLVGSETTWVARGKGCELLVGQRRTWSRFSRRWTARLRRSARVPRGYHRAAGGDRATGRRRRKTLRLRGSVPDNGPRNRRRSGVVRPERQKGSGEGKSSRFTGHRTAGRADPHAAGRSRVAVGTRKLAMGTPARSAEATGVRRSADSSVGAGSDPSLTADSLVDRFLKLLALHPDDMIPIPTYFAMERTPTGDRSLAQRVGEGQRTGGAGGGGRGGGGGAGGRGGMGGGDAAAWEAAAARAAAAEVGRRDPRTISREARREPRFSMRSRCSSAATSPLASGTRSSVR